MPKGNINGESTLPDWIKEKLIQEHKEAGNLWWRLFENKPAPHYCPYCGQVTTVNAEFCCTECEEKYHYEIGGNE